MKKIIFFDLDGTISDSGEGITNAITYAQEKLKLKPVTNEEKHACIGPPLADSFMRLWQLTFEEAEHMIDVYREYYNETGIYENHLYPGVKELLKTLFDAGFELRICSAKPLVMVERVLKHFGVYGYFHSLNGAELHGKYPGKAKLIGAVLKDTNARAVMIGDRKDDIEGAKANNIPSIGVLWGYGSVTELKNAGADHTVSSCDEILALLPCIFN